MRRIVLTGGPGAGKTTALDLLNSRGYTTGGDAARSIIRERKGRGLPPRPEPRIFAEQVFEQEVKAYDTVDSSPAFFERGVVEAVASLVGAGVLNEDDVNRLLSDYSYQVVFIFPPWEEIYRTDDERDHTFEHSARVYKSILGFYRQHEYEPIEVPLGENHDRVDFILDNIDTN